MKQEEIQERNKQIALMLGYNIPSIQFNESWHYLMEAVEFIEGLKWFVTISGNECTVFNFEYKHTARGRCYNTLAPTKKEAVFIAVSDFAKLYNEGNYENF